MQPTESEMKERKLRIEDGMQPRAGVEEEAVAGGTAYLNVLPKVASLLETTEGDIRTGVKYCS